MAISREYSIYIMTNTHHTVLYTGVTNNLQRRAFEHKDGNGGTFTGKYNSHKLVDYEVGEDIRHCQGKTNQRRLATEEEKSSKPCNS